MNQTGPHLVFLFSDTGGGHRSAAQAIIGALEQGYPGRFTVDMLDIFRDFAPPLLDRVVDIYPPLSAIPGYWDRSSTSAMIRSVFAGY